VASSEVPLREPRWWGGELPTVVGIDGATVRSTHARDAPERNPNADPLVRIAIMNPTTP
jgi:hypothetical protein